jgi:hypothetical protein
VPTRSARCTSRPIPFTVLSFDGHSPFRPITVGLAFSPVSSLPCLLRAPGVHSVSCRGWISIARSSLMAGEGEGGREIWAQRSGPPMRAAPGICASSPSVSPLSSRYPRYPRRGRWVIGGGGEVRKCRCRCTRRCPRSWPWEPHPYPSFLPVFLVHNIDAVYVLIRH